MAARISLLLSVLNAELLLMFRLHTDKNMCSVADIRQIVKPQRSMNVHKGHPDLYGFCGATNCFVANKTL